ncbi:MFS transporter [Nocardioides sp. Bht2]|uniref:MFS transporter n=1 Tax=Nocardioides sp. Bht2 TaxID=3392297 RepID=UPI0039B48EC6
MTAAPRPTHNRRLVWGAGTLVLVTMVASYAPSPLYPLYQERWGLSPSQVSVIFAGYPIGVILTLIAFGGLSDRIGRRRAMLVGITGLVSAMTLLACAPTYGWLIVGRVVHGLAAGLITAAAAASLMEEHPRGVSAGSFINAFLVSLGVALGPFAAGLLADGLPRPLATPYLAIGALLAVPMLTLARAADRRPLAGTPGAGLRPIGVPREVRSAFAVAAFAIISTNVTFGLIGAFGPHLARTLGWTSESATGQLVALPLVAVALIQLAAHRLRPQLTVVVGTILSTGCWLLLSFGTSADSRWVVLVGLALLGAGAGLSLLGAATIVGLIAPPGRQAETYAAWLVVAFSTLGGSALLAGPLVGRWPLDTVLIGTAAAAALLAWQVTVRNRREPWERYA